MNRRDFLRQATIGVAVTSATLLVGDQLLEYLDRLAPRRLYFGGMDTLHSQTLHDLSESTYTEWNLGDLYAKTNTDLKVGFRMVTPESEWLRGNVIVAPRRNMMRLRLS